MCQNWIETDIQLKSSYRTVVYMDVTHPLPVTQFKPTWYSQIGVLIPVFSRYCLSVRHSKIYIGLLSRQEIAHTLKTFELSSLPTEKNTPTQLEAAVSKTAHSLALSNCATQIWLYIKYVSHICIHCTPSIVWLSTPLCVSYNDLRGFTSGSHL